MTNIEKTLELFQALKQDFCKIKLAHQNLELQNKDLKDEQDTTDSRESSLLNENGNLKTVIKELQKYKQESRQLSEEKGKLKRTLTEWESIKEESEKALRREKEGLEAELRKVNGEFQSRKSNLEARLRDVMYKNAQLEGKVQEEKAEKRKYQSQLREAQMTTDRKMQQMKKSYEAKLREAKQKQQHMACLASPARNPRKSPAKPSLTERHYETKIRQLEQALLEAKHGRQRGDASTESHTAGPYFSGPPTKQRRSVRFMD